MYIPDKTRISYEASNHVTMGQVSRSMSSLDEPFLESSISSIMSNFIFPEGKVHKCDSTREYRAHTSACISVVDEDESLGRLDIPLAQMFRRGKRISVHLR